MQTNYIKNITDKAHVEEILSAITFEKCDKLLMLNAEQKKKQDKIHSNDDSTEAENSGLCEYLADSFYTRKRKNVIMKEVENIQQRSRIWMRG